MDDVFEKPYRIDISMRSGYSSRKPQFMVELRILPAIFLGVMEMLRIQVIYQIFKMNGKYYMNLMIHLIHHSTVYI